MTTRNLTTRTQAVGARSVSRHFLRVARAADEVGDQTREAARGAGIMSRSLEDEHGDPEPVDVTLQIDSGPVPSVAFASMR